MLSEKQLIANRQNALRSTGPRTAAGRAVSSQNAVKHGLRAEQIVIVGESGDDYEQFFRDLTEQLFPVGVLEARLTGQIAAALWKLQRMDRMESGLLRHMQDAQQKQQQIYEQHVLAAEERINDAKSVYHSVMAAADARIHYVNFDDAQAAWLQTADGKAWQENRWPADHDDANPTLAFNAFWAEQDRIIEAQLKEKEQAPSESAEASPDETDRMDLSYQVMQEQRQRMPQSEQNQDDTPAKEDMDSSSKLASQFTDPIPLGKAIQEDFSGPNVMLKFSRYRTQSERSLYRALNELNKLQYLRKQCEAIDVQAAKEVAIE